MTDDALILAIETSCDDTCAAVITGAGAVRANVISSQGVHDRYGGVVPEIASRQHLELLPAVVEDALARAGSELDEITLVAATRGPGLVAALLVGFSAAKAIAAARRLPFAPVDHLHGHLAAAFLRGTGDAAPGGWRAEPLEPPFLALIASGGHTMLADVRGPHWTADDVVILGQTLDDAAGEAFDKGARLLGLGYPGGAALERLATGGDPEAFAFPDGRRMGGLDFSFAGLKTALLYAVRDMGQGAAQARRADLAASYQAAIVRATMIRVRRALAQTGRSRLALGGGVAANGPLRRAVAELGIEVDVPPGALCTDNAAMIASAARYTPVRAFPDYLAVDVFATGTPGAGPR